MGVFRQFKAIAKKNFLIQRRHFWRVTFWRLILPFILGLLVSVLTLPYQLQSSWADDKDQKRDLEKPADPKQLLIHLAWIYLIIIPVSV